MLLEKLFGNLALTVDPFATCRLADGWRLRLPVRDWGWARASCST